MAIFCMANRVGSDAFLSEMASLHFELIACDSPDAEAYDATGGKALIPHRIYVFRDTLFSGGGGNRGNRENGGDGGEEKAEGVEGGEGAAGTKGTEGVGNDEENSGECTTMGREDKESSGELVSRDTAVTTSAPVVPIGPDVGPATGATGSVARRAALPRMALPLVPLFGGCSDSSEEGGEEEGEEEGGFCGGVSSAVPQPPKWGHMGILHQWRFSVPQRTVTGGGEDVR